MKIRSLVVVSVLSVMAWVGSAYAMPVGSVTNSSLIKKAQVVIQRTTTVVRRRPAVIVKRPTIIKKTVIVR